MPDTDRTAADRDDEARAEEVAARRLDVKEMAAERTTLLLAVFGFALLVIKVARVSHLNSRTSHGLIENVGPVSVILGELVGHFPVIMFIVSVLALWWAIGSWAQLQSFTFGHAAVAATLLFAVLLLPWPYLIVLAALGAVRFILSKRAPHKVGKRARHYYVMIGALAVLLLADSDVWFPPETFSLKNGDTFVGYSLSEPGNALGWVVILTEEERMIIRVHQEQIEDRQPCRHISEDIELQNFPSLLQLAVREDARLPEPLCDESG